MGWLKAIAIAALVPTALVQSTLAQPLDLTVTRLQTGTILPVAAVAATEILPQDTLKPVELVIAENVLNDRGEVAIPAGTVVHGEFQPRQGGGQIVASLLQLNGRAYQIRAVSGFLYDEKDPNQVNTRALGEDALIGAAAGVALGVLTGGVSTLGVVGGMVSGVTVGNITAPRSVVLPAGQVIPVTLEHSLDL